MKKKSAPPKKAAKPRPPAKAAPSAKSKVTKGDDRGPVKAKASPAKVAAAPGRAALKAPAGGAAPVSGRAEGERGVKKGTAESSSTKRRAGAPAKPPDSRNSLRLGEFREQLVRKHDELLQAYHNAKGDSRSRQSDGTEDYIDYAVSSYDREFLLSLTEMERKQILLVQEALRRVDGGDFGRCLNCNQSIPPKRLEVQPWARYCVSCQELEDQGLLETPTGDSDDELDDLRIGIEPAPDVEEEPEIEYEEEIGIDEPPDDDDDNLSLS